MPVTQHGIIYYNDDPHKRVFRRVFPTWDDSELDQPPTGPDGKPIAGETWASYATDKARPTAMEKISSSDATSRLRGTPATPASEPVIYYVNADSFLASLSPTEWDTYQNWLGANPQWSNQMVSLGSGDVLTLTASCVAPCWIIIVGTGTPAIGTLQKTQTFKAQQISQWVA
jgi:hypothetical protein